MLSIHHVGRADVYLPRSRFGLVDVLDFERTARVHPFHDVVKAQFAQSVVIEEQAVELQQPVAASDV